MKEAMRTNKQASRNPERKYQYTPRSEASTLYTYTESPLLNLTPLPGVPLGERNKTLSKNISTE
jgi:hypothetical protein